MILYSFSDKVILCWNVFFPAYNVSIENIPSEHIVSNIDTKLELLSDILYMQIES